MPEKKFWAWTVSALGLAQTVLNILDYMEVVERVGRGKDGYIYQIKY